MKFYVCAPFIPRDRFEIDAIESDVICRLRRYFALETITPGQVFSNMDIIRNRSGESAMDYDLNNRSHGKIMINVSEMLDDIAWCDACYFISGWEQSAECTIARNACLELGVPIYDEAEDGTLVKYTNDMSDDRRTNMHRVFISVPMRGRANSEVRMDIARATRIIKKLFDSAGKEVEIIHNFDCVVGPPEDCVHLVTNSLRYLGEAVRQMAFCDMVFFCYGWENSPGCNIEREICKRYNIKIIDEEAADAAVVSKSL